jgi:hypothetical protein
MPADIGAQRTSATAGPRRSNAAAHRSSAATIPSSAMNSSTRSGTCPSVAASIAASRTTAPPAQRDRQVAGLGGGAVEQ